MNPLMNREEAAEDISLLLLLVPFVVSAAGGLLRSLGAGLSVRLSAEAYLSVTKNPIIFLVGFVAVCGSLVVQVAGTGPEARRGRLASGGKRLGKLAVASLILAILGSWSASGFSFSLSDNLALLLEGRYALIFPLAVFVLSGLLSAQIGRVKFSVGNWRNLLGMGMIVASPLSFAALGGIAPAVVGGLGMLLLLAGFIILMVGR
jgi:hypothetical protein